MELIFLLFLVLGGLGIFCFSMAVIVIQSLERRRVHATCSAPAVSHCKLLVSKSGMPHSADGEQECGIKPIANPKDSFEVYSR
jgi:hypothetical protein